MTNTSKKDIARAVCEAADISGCKGKQWGTMAHSMSLLVELVDALLNKLATLGHEAEGQEVQGENEICRLAGNDVVVVVEQSLTDTPEGKGLAYELAVCCRDMENRESVAQALWPIVDDYGNKHLPLVKSYVEAAKENLQEPADGTAGAGPGRHSGVQQRP